MDRIEHVKDHFNSEAGIFDKRVVKMVPYYEEMLGSVVTMIPFSKNDAFRVIDLGSGTGTLAYLIKKHFPRARVLCVDQSRNMLSIAARKLKGLKGLEFIEADITKYNFERNNGAIVSSLALHHLVPGKEKREIYEKIYSSLKKGGVVINADIIMSGSMVFQQKYLKKWGEFVLRSSSREQMHENHKRYKREDRPADLVNEIGQLKKIGFRHVDIFWKYYNFATYGGIK